MPEGEVAQFLTLVVVLIAGVGLAADRFLSRKRNNNNNRHLHNNPKDPDKVPLGDVTVGWWEKKMDTYTAQIVAAINNLKKE